ncbi:uncharacterized protein PGTG_21982 [Puccinia graminis f. sp. tritici CRL 75-36-700-3]|uniref:Uncharacterized protein n=1 Tax=Puccinia graminis f. sp. tritici (strain CRL 75-36-700-3 / race SCCL) TaxID=418459 RepID=H6QT22_PUCGT|nr:uncharacterized protein PGTG_21982 [Puccinia graminis f. sp. tritici CRL 75-36-700-3]EHS63979.1 hypothetical protein PGTG_21982 [Puccinia graminis f. sp. tritici CRL 75-36-700-3]
MGASSKTSGCHDASETLCLRRQHRHPGRTGDAFTWVDCTQKPARLFSKKCSAEAGSNTSCQSTRDRSISFRSHYRQTGVAAARSVT